MKIRRSTTTNNFRQLLHSCAVLGAVLASTPALAQLALNSSIGGGAPSTGPITNGDFSALASGWTWKYALVATSSSSCGSQSLQTFNPTANVVSSLRFFPGQSSGNPIANLSAGTAYGNDPYLFCTEISQTVSIPAAAKDLSFRYKLGDTIGYSFDWSAKTAADVKFDVIAVPTNGGTARNIFTDTGRTIIQNALNQCPGRCPEWEDGRANLAQFAGQTVVLKFRTESRQARSAQANAMIRSQAYLDDLTLIDAILPTANLTASHPTLTIPQGQTATTQISWSSSNVTNLDIMMSVDGGAESIFQANVPNLTGSKPATIYPGHNYLFRAVGRAFPSGPAIELKRTVVQGILGGCTTTGSAPLEGWYLDDARPNTALQLATGSDGSIIFGWLTYDLGGAPIWYFGQPTSDACGKYTGTIQRYQRNPFTGAISQSDVATISLLFSGNGGTFSYDFGGQSMTVPINYFQFASGFGSPNLTGFYADSSRERSGTYIISQGNTHLVANYIYDASGNPVWTFGSQQTINGTVSNVPMQMFYGTGRCPLCTSTPNPIGSTAVGTLDLIQQGLPGILVLDGNLSGNGINWPFSWTIHGKL